MKKVRGTYIGTGVPFLLDIGVSLGKRVTGFMLVKGDAATDGVMYREDRGVPSSWCGRSNTMLATESFNDGLRFAPGGVQIGADARINTSGVTYYYSLTLDSGDEDFDMSLACGNASPTLPRDYLLRIQKTPIAGLIKRDSNAPPVLFSSYGATTTTAESGGALGSNSFVDSLSTGKITVHAGYTSAQWRVNQLNGTSGQLGEGHELLAFFDSPDIRVTTYVSDGVAGREIVVADQSNPAEEVWVYRQAAGGGSMRFKTLDMVGSAAAPMTAAAVQPTDFSISGDGTKIVVGSTTAAINGSGAGITFVVIAFLQSGFLKSYKAAPSIIIKKKRAIRLDGRSASAIDCGVSDATLKIDGAMTITWAGVVRALSPGASGTYEVPLALRSNSYNTVGDTSYGIGALRQSTGKSWGGPFIQTAVTTRWANSLADCRDICRTGILLPIQVPFAVSKIHDGNGRHLIVLSERLAYQRDLNLTITPLWGGNGGAVSGAPENIAAYPAGAPNIQSGAGHRMTIGARSTSGGAAYSCNLNGLVYEASVANLAWTLDEVIQEHRRILYGTGAAEVTRGLAEKWDADRAFGNRVPALINGANDGTLSGGSVIVL